MQDIETSKFDLAKCSEDDLTLLGSRLQEERMRRRFERSPSKPSHLTLKSLSILSEGDLELLCYNEETKADCRVVFSDYDDERLLHAGTTLVETRTIEVDDSELCFFVSPEHEIETRQSRTAIEAVSKSLKKFCAKSSSVSSILLWLSSGYLGYEKCSDKLVQEWAKKHLDRS